MEMRRRLSCFSCNYLLIRPVETLIQIVLRQNVYHKLAELLSQFLDLCFLLLTLNPCMQCHGNDFFTTCISNDCVYMSQPQLHRSCRPLTAVQTQLVEYPGNKIHLNLSSKLALIPKNPHQTESHPVPNAQSSKQTPILDFQPLDHPLTQPGPHFLLLPRQTPRIALR